MSSPYRDGAIPTEEVETEEVAKPLATFDVSGKHGNAGADGAHGEDGYSSGASGSSGGNAGPAQPGFSAGRIALELAADTEAHSSVRLVGEMVMPNDQKREIRDLVMIDEAGYIQLSAIGGNGGRGGNG